MATANLSNFWKRTIEELAKSEPNPELEEAPELSVQDYRTRRVILDSFQGRRLRGCTQRLQTRFWEANSLAVWGCQDTAAPRLFRSIW